MKWVPERVDETGTELVNGGPCHQSGEGAPHQKINTRARGHTSQTTKPSLSSQPAINPACQPAYQYETDEEEFMPVRQRATKSTQKKKPKHRAAAGYNLGYLSLWWKRMEREGLKEGMEKIRREEEARRTKIKRWLTTKKQDIRSKRWEGGPRDQQQQGNTSLFGGVRTTGGNSHGPVVGEGVVQDENIIFERSQPNLGSNQLLYMEQTDIPAATKVNQGARESESELNQ